MFKKSKILIILFSIIGFLFPVDLVVAPYLQNATPNSMTIMWETDSESPSIVEWRPYMTGYFNSPETIVLSD